MEEKLSLNVKIVHAVVSAAILVVVFVVAVTIASELLVPFKNWLTINFGHHWVGKGAIALFLYLLFSAATYFLSPPKHAVKLVWHLLAVSWVGVIGALGIIIFYIFEGLA